MNEKQYIGIDLSSYQKNLTDAAVLQNAGIKFAILKIGEGTSCYDDAFSAHYTMCKNAGIPTGVYLYSHSTSAAGGKAEAEFAIRVLNGRGLELPIFIDIEGDILNYGKAVLMESALAFGTTVTAARHKWGVYASLSRFGPLLDADALRAAGAIIWCAAYNNTGPGMDCDIWQRCDNWRVDYYKYNLDADVMYNTALLDDAEEVFSVSKIEKAAAYMEAIANDASHGYDQANRWGPDYDCSSLVITAYEQAGVPVKSSGATYTGNMRSVFLKCGFRDVTSEVDLNSGAGTARGDVLLNDANHTAMVIGNGRIAYASINESGKTTGGQSGDQTGGEIKTRGYYNYPWNCVLRYIGGSSGPALGDNYAVTPTPVFKYCTPKLRELGRGDKDTDNDHSTKTLQELLIQHGYDVGDDGADGDFGSNTLAAVKQFQSDVGLDDDGVCGALTWAKLIEG